MLTVQGKMRAGFRAALRTNRSAFQFQSGGRSLAWFKAHPIPRTDISALLARTGLFWSAHEELLKEMWLELQISEVGEWSLFDVVRDWRKNWTSVRRMDVDAMEPVLRWYFEAKPAALQWFRKLSKRTLDPALIVLVSWALARNWSWFPTMLEEAFGTYTAMEKQERAKRREAENAAAGAAAMVVDGQEHEEEEKRTANDERESESKAECDEEGLAAMRMLLFCGAAEAGSMELLQKYKLETIDDREHPEWAGDLLVCAAHGGSLEILRWLDEEGYARPDRVSAFARRHTVIGACQAGHLPVLDWLSRHITFSSSFDRSINAAAGSGRKHVVDWLCARGMATATADGLADTAENGHLELLQRLHEQWPDETCSERAIVNVALLSPPDTLGVVQFLLSKELCALSPAVIEKAAVHTHNVREDVLRFLLVRGGAELWEQVQDSEIARVNVECRDRMRHLFAQVHQDAHVFV